MHLEILFDKLGGLGAYQIRVILFLATVEIIVSPSMMMMAFAGVEPDWWCVARDKSSDAMFRNGSYRNCEWNSTCDRRYDNAMVTAVSEWDLACSKQSIVNTIISIQMAGVFFGNMILGYGADTYGRKKMLFGGILLCTVGNIVSAFSVSWIMFAILRFVLGFSVGLTQVLYIYQFEFVGKGRRSVVASLPSWAIGVVMFAGLAWAIQNWKWLHLVLAVICLPCLLSWCCVPESLRWLTVKGHLKEAQRLVNKMATINKRTVPDTSILELIAEEEKTEGNKANVYSYLDLFKTRSMTRRTFFTCFIWFSLSMIYYAIAFGVKDLSGHFYMNLMIMSVLDLPGYLNVFFLVHLFKRRPTAAILLFIMTVCCFGVAIASRMAPPNMKVPLENGLAITVKFFALSAWGVAQAMTAEQYPTVVRNLAYAAQNTAARIGGVLAAQLLSLGAKDDLMPPFVAMGILSAVTALVCFTMEETSNTALEDTMKKNTLENPNEKGLETLMQNADTDAIVKSRDTDSERNTSDVTYITTG